MKKQLKSTIKLKNKYLQDFEFETIEDGFLGIPKDYIDQGYFYIMFLY